MVPISNKEFLEYVLRKKTYNKYDEILQSQALISFGETMPLYPFIYKAEPFLRVG